MSTGEVRLGFVAIFLVACAPAVADSSAVADTPVVAAAAAGPQRLDEAFPPPPGASRVPADGFGGYLRGLALYPADRQVLTHAGVPVAMPAARVVDVPLVRGDLQQCADSILRLRATWERNDGRDPAFRYTSGDLSRWSDWKQGTRLVVSGNRVTRVVGKAKADASDASFEAWMADLFTYAGTRSLPTDAPAAAGPIAPGDFLVTPGSPGHAVLILDVATRGDAAWVLVGQGYMPAMDFHVVEGETDGWFAVTGDTLDTRPIPMSWSTRRRFP